VPLLEGIRTTRAIRRLRPDPVPKALIRKVCEAGTFAPSGGNRQPWTFVAVTEPERRAFVAERYRRAFSARTSRPPRGDGAAGLPGAAAPHRLAAVYLAEHLHEVPVHLFVAGWLRRGQEQTQALFPAIQNVLLACRAVGLGACLTTVHRAFGDEIDAFLGLPKERPTCALLPIGWPLGRYGRPPRRRSTWLKRMVSSSYAHRFLSDRLKVLGHRIRSLRGPAYKDVEGAPPDPDAERAWEVTFAALREMQATARAYGAAFALVLVPDQVQVQKDARVYGAPAALYTVPERIGGFGAAEGIAVIDPAPALLARYEEEGQHLYFPRDRHLNPRGQRLLAEVILRDLRERGWLADEGPPSPTAGRGAPSRAQSSR
jgi:nitroreductase